MEKLERTNRLPKHKDCKHEYRLLTKYKGYYVFYCTKCLLFCFKDEDTPLKEWINKHGSNIRQATKKRT